MSAHSRFGGIAWLGPRRFATICSRGTTNVRRLTIHYRAHDGHRRAAVLVLPSWYGRHRHPRIPLVISPHGRGVSAWANARLWGGLPTRGGFAVVNPDGEGRNLSRLSWGYPQQIHDLARMPAIVERALPWVHVDRHRIFRRGAAALGADVLIVHQPRNDGRDQQGMTRTSQLDPAIR